MITKIKILSDNNELTFIRNGSTKDTFVYAYTKSFTKLKKEVTWTKVEMDKMIKNNIVKEIK